MNTETNQECYEFELICNYSKLLNGRRVKFPFLPFTGDKIEVDGKLLNITARRWDHSVDPPEVRLEVHLDH